MTADDLGLASGINRGIMDCVEKGIVSSVSLCVNGRAAEEALDFCKNHPRLDTGLHLVLAGEKALSRASGENGLSGKSGDFFRNWATFLAAYFSRRIDQRGLEKEIEAQFKKLSGAGIRVIHVNSHQHLHILPGILNIVMANCRKYGVRFIRLPYSRPARHWLFADWHRVILQIAVNLLCALNANKIRAAGLRTCDNTTGVLYSGRMGSTALRRFVSSLKIGKSEIIFHPGRVDEELLFLYGHWGYSWEEETNLLCSCDIKKLLDEEMISLMSFSSRREYDGR